MNGCKLIFILLLISNFSFSQDFIVLKKKTKVIKTWFSGQYLSAELTNGNWITAIINKIENDTLYVQPYSTPIVFNSFGMPIIDTVFYGRMKISPNNLHAFPKEQPLSFIKNGAILQWGGGGYLILNVINTLSRNQPVFGSKNIAKIGLAAAVFAIGTFIHKTHKSNYIIGKKYHMQYISSKPSS